MIHSYGMVTPRIHPTLFVEAWARGIGDVALGLIGRSAPNDGTLRNEAAGGAR